MVASGRTHSVKYAAVMSVMESDEFGNGANVEVEVMRKTEAVGTRKVTAVEVPDKVGGRLPRLEWHSRSKQRKIWLGWDCVGGNAKGRGRR